MDFAVAVETVKFPEPVTPFNVALIAAVPADLAVASPEAFTVAMAPLLVDQVEVDVRSKVEPSL